MKKQSVAWLAVGIVFLAMSSAVAAGLPDTGQTKCYDTAGAEITCPQPGEALYGQDAEYVKARSYTDLGNGIVRDNVTGLEWIQDGNLIATRDPGFDNDSTAGDGRVTYGHAFDYVALLNAQEYLGYDDWRLPTIQELSSLVDSSRNIPAIDPIFSAEADYYYTCNFFYDYSVKTPWLVDFYRGGVNVPNRYMRGAPYVRAVRNALPAKNFIDNGDGTITDTATGLMWQKDYGIGTWQQALAYCDNLELAGYTDWRLPDRSELLSICQLDPAFFIGSSNWHWSSTTYVASPGSKWAVYGGWLLQAEAWMATGVFSARAVRGGHYVLLGDLGSLCIEDYHCDEGDACVEGVCETKVDDDPPALGAGPFVAAGWWPLLSASVESPTFFNQNYNVLWTFSDDFAACSEDCTHSAEYSVAGTSDWTPITVSSDAANGYAWVELPIDQLQNATTYVLRFTVTDCAGQTTESDTYYFRVSTSDAPPVITGGPWLAAGSWPALPTSASRAVVLDQDRTVLWTFSDDYAYCAGLCTHRARFRKVGDEAWRGLEEQTDPTSTCYAYTTLPVESLDAGTYQFRVEVIDCAGQQTGFGKLFYFAVP